MSQRAFVIQLLMSLWPVTFWLLCPFDIQFQYQSGTLVVLRGTSWLVRNIHKQHHLTPWWIRWTCRASQDDLKSISMNSNALLVTEQEYKLPAGLVPHVPYTISINGRHVTTHVICVNDIALIPYVGYFGDSDILPSIPKSSRRSRTLVLLECIWQTVTALSQGMINNKDQRILLNNL